MSVGLKTLRMELSERLEILVHASMKTSLESCDLYVLLAGLALGLMQTPQQRYMRTTRFHRFRQKELETNFSRESLALKVFRIFWG